MLVVVLILVLVEDGLRGSALVRERVISNRLNPCSCGGWSQRQFFKNKGIHIQNVLILVLVEDGLREELSGLSPHKWDSLNPCSCGGWSQRQKISNL